MKYIGAGTVYHAEHSYRATDGDWDDRFLLVMLDFIQDLLRDKFLWCGEVCVQPVTDGDEFRLNVFEDGDPIPFHMGVPDGWDVGLVKMLFEETVYFGVQGRLV